MNLHRTINPPRVTRCHRTGPAGQTRSPTQAGSVTRRAGRCREPISCGVACGPRASGRHRVLGPRVRPAGHSDPHAPDSLGRSTAPHFLLAPCRTGGCGPRSSMGWGGQEDTSLPRWRSWPPGEAEVAGSPITRPLGREAGGTGPRWRPEPVSPPPLSVIKLRGPSGAQGPSGQRPPGALASRPRCQAGRCTSAFLLAL